MENAQQGKEVEPDVEEEQEDRLGIEDQLAYLHEHDGEWLARTLRERCKQLGYHGRTTEGNAVEQRSPRPAQDNVLQPYGPGPDTSLAGPCDVTAPILPSQWENNEHVALLRNFPWHTTELGPMSEWSIELRRMVNFTLQDRRSAVLWWGPMRRCEQVQRVNSGKSSRSRGPIWVLEAMCVIYNEAYDFTLGSRHPWALGKCNLEVWPELVNAGFAKSFDHADRTGEASFEDSVRFFVSRNGYNEEVHAGWSMRPVAGSSTPGANLGYYNSVVENTREVLHERRMVTIHAIEEETSKASSMRDYYTRVLRGLESTTDEIPFAALYGPATISKEEDKLDVDDAFTGDSSSHSEYGSVFAGKEWTLEGVLSPLNYTPPLPSRVDLDTGTDLLTPMFRSAMLSKTVQVLRSCDGSLPKHLRDMAKSRAFEGDTCDTAILCPLYSTYQEHRSGFLLLGLNTRRTYDQEYQRFVRLLVNQLTTALSSVVMAEDEARRSRISAKLAAQDRMQLVEKLAASTQGLRDSEMRFRSMADLAPVGIFEFDSGGRLLFANQRWLELTGNSGVACQDIRRGNLVVDTDRDAYEAHWHQLLAGEQVDHFEFRLSRPFITDETFDGERLQGETWVLIAAYALRDDSDSSGGDSCVKGVFGCLVDISRQKWMEGFQVRKVKEQEERRRHITSYMDKTNHEARNPLAAITLCADEMYTTINDLLSLPSELDATLGRQAASTLLENVETIIACAKHQKRIIEDVLVASKLESGLLSMSPTPIRVTEVIESALKMFKTELQRSNVDIRYTVGQSYRDLDIQWVLLDSTRLLQVLLNLLTNAIKFTKFEDSRKITVRLEAIATCPTEADLGVKFVSASRNSNAFLGTHPLYLSISIQDTGSGISSHDFTGLFERFRQAPNQNNKTYATYGGSGLGLWISRELCEQMGGQIGAASSPSGSTFAFYVQTSRCSRRMSEAPPLPKKEARENIQRELSAAIGGVFDHDIHVKPAIDRPIAALIVEDNLLNQKVMRKQLTRAGLSTAVANHGQEALDYIYGKSRPPLDVVLMDIEMPVLDGLAATRAIRAREQSQKGSIRLPILGVTANARQEQLDHARSVGMDDIITKPFHMKDLLSAINRVRG